GNWCLSRKKPCACTGIRTRDSKLSSIRGYHWTTGTNCTYVICRAGLSRKYYTKYDMNTEVVGFVTFTLQLNSQELYAGQSSEQAVETAGGHPSSPRHTPFSHRGLSVPAARQFPSVSSP
ncbi:unnamed protein product, partial [Laminaria digitata]